MWQRWMRGLVVENRLAVTSRSEMSVSLLGDRAWHRSKNRVPKNSCLRADSRSVTPFLNLHDTTCYNEQLPLIPQLYSWFPACLILLIVADMASKKTLIQRSNVLQHPLGGGQAGLSRELGLADKKSGMLLTWSHGLRPSIIWWFDEMGSLTNLVYDQTMQGAIIGMKVKTGTSVGSEM